MTDREVIDILSNHTNLGYGIVIEGNTKKIREALSIAIDSLESIKTGEWIISQTMDCHSDIINIYTCPFCGEKEYSAYPYCHCGAKLRKPQTQKFADNDTAYGGLASAT